MIPFSNTVDSRVFRNCSYFSVNHLSLLSCFLSFLRSLISPSPIYHFYSLYSLTYYVFSSFSSSMISANYTVLLYYPFLTLSSSFPPLLLRHKSLRFPLSSSPHFSSTASSSSSVPAPHLFFNFLSSYHPHFFVFLPSAVP